MRTEDEFLKRLLNGEISMSEENGFFNKEGKYDEVSDALKMSSEFSVPSIKSKEQAWTELEAKLYDEVPKLGRNKVIFHYRKKRFSVMAVAASVALLIGIYFVFLQKNETIFITGNGETRAIKLPDNSIATLNADSKISFNADDWNNNRIILLKGEAFFEVEKGSKFSVVNDDKVVEVLGTSFNVKSRNNLYQVACFTGKVAVKLAAETVRLEKGEAINVIKEVLSEPFTFEKKKVKGWEIGKFYFDEVPLQDVFDEFERQYNVQLDYTNDVATRIYSGYFSNKNIKDALQLICDPMRLSYKDHGNGFITVKSYAVK